MIRVTDSTDAREQREREQEAADAAVVEAGEHAARCRGGWVGEDAEGRPMPCPRCRPHLLEVQCATCSVAYQACARQQAARRGPCCDRCRHSRRAAA